MSKIAIDSMTRDASETIEAEFAGAAFGDLRLSKRLLSVAVQLAESPASSLPDCFKDSSALEGTYRFFSNPSVSPEAILAPHVSATVVRGAEYHTLVVAHDTTTFNYRAGGKRRGLGVHGKSQQFFAHVSLAVSGDEARVPLGVLAISTFAQKGGISRESGTTRWLAQALDVDALIKFNSRIVHVMDREADNYLTLSGLVQRRQRFVVRGDDDRLLVQSTPEEPRTLAEALERVQLATTREVHISPRTPQGRHNADKRRRHPPRSGRLAHLHVGATRVLFKRPKDLGEPVPATCELNAVRVWEPAPPAGEPPVIWLLLTTEPIDTPEQLLAIVDMYRSRWRIEEFFKSLKTGCEFEKKQLDSYDALTNALAVYTPIAWRLLHLRSETGRTPLAPASSILDEEELIVLGKIVRKPLPRNPTRRDVLLAIARLGGHLKHNGEPGWQTLARGWEHLTARVEGFRLCSDSSRRTDES